MEKLTEKGLYVFVFRVVGVCRVLVKRIIRLRGTALGRNLAL